MSDQQQPAPASTPAAGEDQVVVVGPDGQPIGTIPVSALPEMTQVSDDGGDGATARASGTSPSWSSSRPR